MALPCTNLQKLSNLPVVAAAAIVLEILQLQYIDTINKMLILLMMMLNKEEDVKNLLNPHGVSALFLFSYFLQLSIFHCFLMIVITLIHLDI